MKNKKLYTVKDFPIDNKCPLCGSKLAGCHIGDYCSNKKCGYVDGIACLTEKQAKRLKNKLETK